MISQPQPSHTHTHTPPGKRRVNHGLFNITLRHFSPLTSLGAVLMLGWPIDETSAPSTASQKSNNQRQHRLEKSERGFAWNQGLVMILADRKENGPCSEKSVCSWINSIQPCVEAPEGWWGCMLFLGRARRPEHPCPQPYSTGSHQWACFRLGPPQR